MDNSKMFAEKMAKECGISDNRYDLFEQDIMVLINAHDAELVKATLWQAADLFLKKSEWRVRKAILALLPEKH